MPGLEDIPKYYLLGELCSDVRQERKKKPSYKKFDPDGKTRLKTLAEIQITGLHGIVHGIVQEILQYYFNVIVQLKNS